MNMLLEEGRSRREETTKVQVLNPVVRQKERGVDERSFQARLLFDGDVRGSLQTNSTEFR